MSTRPKLLFLCQTLPYPPDSGVNIRAFHTLRLLARDFDVTGLFFFRRAYREDTSKVEEGCAGLRPYAHVQAFPIPQEWSTTRTLVDHARSLAAGTVYTRFVYDSAAFRAALEDILGSTTFDLAHVDSLDLSAYLPLLVGKGVPVVCGHHNVESALLRRRSAGARNPLSRAYLAFQAAAYAREESKWMPRARSNIAVSEDDAADFRVRVPTARVEVVPSGVDVDKFTPSPGGSDGVVFVGGLDWFPNRDALEHYAAEILPLVRKELPAMRSVFVGRAKPSDVQRFAKAGIKVTGHVPEIEPFVAQAACFVVPLRVGGGTRLKVLDAWAMGKAVVSTSVGCEGLRTVDGENILIRDDPGDFAAAITMVMRDPSIRSRLGLAGRLTVERHYSWEGIGTEMRTRYLSLAKGQDAR